MSEGITNQDRDDALIEMLYSVAQLGRELDIVDALDQHQLQFGDSKNLGYYRTFIECSCGAGWWYGAHEGDPSASDRWDIHRAQVIKDLKDGRR